MNFIEHLLFLGCLCALLHVPVDITLNLKHVSGGPSPLGVRQMAFKVRILYQLDGRSATDINVWRADDKVVGAKHRRINFILFRVISEFNVCFELLDEVQALTSKFGVCLLVVPDFVVRLLASAVISSYWGMMGHLLG